jgi:hypothetical protein
METATKASDWACVALVVPFEKATTQRVFGRKWVAKQPVINVLLIHAKILCPLNRAGSRQPSQQG